MTNLFHTAEQILDAETDDLRKLADIAGFDPRVMYLNADLSGADLRNQDVTFLVGLNANYRKAVLTKEQREYLRKHDDTRVEPESRNNWALITEVRIEIITQYLESLDGISDYDSLKQHLLEPLHKVRGKPSATLLEDEYLPYFVQRVSEFYRPLARSLDEQKRLYQTFTRARIMFREPAFDELVEITPTSFRAGQVLSVFAIENCTVGFLIRCAEHIAHDEPQNLFKVLSKVIRSTDPVPDRLAAYVINQEPSLELMLEVLPRLTDNNLVREKIGLANALTAQSGTPYAVKEYAAALAHAPGIRLAYLDRAMKSSKTDIAVAALQARLKESRPVGSIELSDVVYHLENQQARIKYARQTERTLTPHQHRILVEEIEKAARAKTREHSEAIKRIWPTYFGRK